MKQEKEQNEYIEILNKNLLKHKKITSEFIRQYYSASNQARLGLKDLNEFEDALLMNGLAGLNCENLGLDFSQLSQEEFEHFPFDSRTTFSKETIEQFHPEQILERGKNFGLGLSETGLTGKGIHIAIRDENCNPYLTDANIVEYTKIKDGKTYNEVNPDDVEHMHGVTTVSLLASKTCGVAKDSFVHFFSSSDSIDKTIDKSIVLYVEHIVAYNQKCTEENRESDMILVASGSWGDKSFETHRDKLREVGCELVCANNFNKNFGEFTNNGGNIENPLEMPQDKIDEFIEEFPNHEGQIRTVTQNDKIKIPISRTYHQVGIEDGGKPIFKYQSAFSTSWGVPQVAGLLAVFKEIDRNLTFEQFLECAERTATDRNGMKIINPQGIYLEIDRMRKIRYWHDPKSENSFEHINSGLESLGFSEQEIGKATINTPTMSKASAQSRTNKDENEVQQIQESKDIQTGS